MRAATVRRLRMGLSLFMETGLAAEERGLAAEPSGQGLSLAMERGLAAEERGLAAEQRGKGLPLGGRRSHGAAVGGGGSLLSLRSGEMRDVFRENRRELPSEVRRTSERKTSRKLRCEEEEGTTMRVTPRLALPLRKQAELRIRQALLALMLLG